MWWKRIITFTIYLYKNWYKYWVKLLTIIGDIKIYKTPMFVLYNPEEYDYKIRGNQIRAIEELIKPGDVLLRHYDHFLDSWLIPGYYSHSAIYIGEGKIIHAIAEGVREIDLIDFCQCDGICILRPESGQEKAIKLAKCFLGCCYDFRFNSDDSSEFYCHELTAVCYQDLEIQKFYPSFNNKELKFLNAKYLAESFLSNSRFIKVIEFQPNNK